MHVPLKKLTNAEVKLYLKSWLTNDIMTSVRQKNKKYKIFSRAKDCQQKKNCTQNLRIQAYKENMLKIGKNKGHYKYKKYHKEKH